MSCIVGLPVSLSQDPMLCLQVMGLQGVVQAYSLTSLSTKEEAAAVMNALTAVATKPKGKAAASGAEDAAVQKPLLLYCTPEKIVASKRLMSKLEKVYQVCEAPKGDLRSTIGSHRDASCS